MPVGAHRSYALPARAWTPSPGRDTPVLYEDFMWGCANPTAVDKVATVGAAGDTVRCQSGLLIGCTAATPADVLYYGVNAADGQAHLRHSAVAEAQDVFLYNGDHCTLDIDRGIWFTWRWMMATGWIPNGAGDIICMGLATARNTTFNSVTEHAWFRIEADADLMVEIDGNTVATDLDDQDTTLDIVAGTWYQSKLLVLPDRSIEFYHLDESAMNPAFVRCLGATTFAFPTTATGLLQPLIETQKDADVGVHGVAVDYVYCGQINKRTA